MSNPYALVGHIPLIKAPGMWVPKPVPLPPDIHPLPEDVTAYFVYPYSLETSALSHLHSLSSHPQNIAASQATHAAYLADRARRKEEAVRRSEEEAKERRKEELRRVAPGWEGELGSIVQPKRASGYGGTAVTGLASTAPEMASAGPVVGGPEPAWARRDPMDDVVDGLARLDGS